MSVKISTLFDTIARGNLYVSWFLMISVIITPWIAFAPFCKPSMPMNSLRRRKYHFCTYVVKLDKVLRCVEVRHLTKYNSYNGTMYPKGDIQAVDFTTVINLRHSLVPSF